MRTSALTKFVGVLGLAASPLVSPAVAQAEPVTDWVTVFSDATFTNGSEETNSPTITNRGQITANIAPVTLTEVGDSVTLSGSVTINELLNFQDQFRWGLFEGPDPVVAGSGGGYVGVWAAAGKGTNALAVADGSQGNPFSGVAKTDIGTVEVDAASSAGSPISFSLTIQRVSETEIVVTALATATNAANEQNVFDWGTVVVDANPASFTYNSVGFALTSQFSTGVEAAFSDIEVTFVPEPASVGLLGAGALLCLMRRR